MPAAQNELNRPICGRALQAPVAEALEEYDFIRDVWGFWRPGHFPTAPGAAKTAAVGLVMYLLGGMLPAEEVCARMLSSICREGM